MSVVLGQTEPDPQQVIADLQRRLAESNAERDQRATERDEALAREEAIAEVLAVINSSPGDLRPVFEAMLAMALRLCDASFGMMNTFDGERFHRAADCGVPNRYAEFRRHNTLAFAPNTAPGRILAGQDVVHNVDLKAEEAYERGDPNRRALVDLGGARSHVAVALRKDGSLLGHIGIYRQEVRPFTDKQIALLQNFAAQAVIAMGNARLLGDLRERTADLQEALEYQTASSDVLNVISRSSFDLQPVLDAVVETAVRLCKADQAFIFRRDGDIYRLAASFAFAPAYEAIVREHLDARPPNRGSITGRTAIEARVVHVHDVSTDPEFAIPGGVTVGKIRTALGVPLLRDGDPIGVITLSRQQVEPFTDRQIELIRTFADQAVIAIENTRLLTELRESLEQQQAMAEVLQVINSSPGDLAPVFDAMLDRATRLCGAARGQLATYDGERFRFVAVHGDETFVAQQFARGATPPSVGVTWSRIVAGEAVVHIPDVAETELYRSGHDAARRMVNVAGGRSIVTVALRKDDLLLGTLTVYRLEVRPFSDKEIGLLQNFAAQAVIAMENARLITETREALEQNSHRRGVAGHQRCPASAPMRQIC